jgi:mono/diheme cytochrome c family protein
VRFRLSIGAAIGLAALFSCTSQKKPASLAEKGRSVYLVNCISCHNPDPTKDGPLGPAVAGSSLELLSARVMRAEYPPGYKPKRSSHVMAPLPHLKDQLEALHAFLAAP